MSFLGFTDGELEVNLETRRAVTRVVRRVRPEIIVAHDPSALWFRNSYINHWDHKQAGTLALCAVMPDAPSRPQFPELLDEGLEPFEVPHLWLGSEEPDTFVDISDTIETKLEALACARVAGTSRTPRDGCANAPRARRARWGGATPRGSRRSTFVTRTRT